MANVLMNSTPVNFKQYFAVDYALLKLSGIWIGESNQTKPRWYNYYSSVALTFLFSFNLSVLIDWIGRSTNLIQFATVGFVASATMMGPIKEMLLLNNKVGLVALFNKLDNKYFQAQTLEELEVVKQKLHTFTTIRKVMSFVGWFSVLMCCISPIFYETEQGLIVSAWYPFNVATSPTYQIVYIHQTVGLIFTSIGFIYADLLMGTHCIFIGLQCSLLAIRLTKIGNDGKDEKESLFNCIQHHRHIVRFYKITNDVFGNMFFGQLFSTTTSLCMALFLFSLTKPGSFMFFLYMSVISSMGNFLLVPCLFASEMTTKSEAISIAAFNSTWVDGSNTFKKDLMFFICITQKPLALNVGGFFEMSKATFVAVARTAVSYYTVLNNLNS